MSIETLIDRTRQQFPHYQGAPVKIVPLEKGGSNRKYYRVRFSGDYSLILVKYDLTKPENPRFASIANFFDGIGINAPLIYFHDPEEGLIWMQDLGEEDLWHYRNESWEIRRSLYRKALEQTVILHQVDPKVAGQLDLVPGFDQELYRWEQNYCFENCFQRYFKISKDSLRDISEHPAWENMARELASCSRVLVHRDLQSQNVIIQDDEAYLIDFQGMRLGLGAYDLASLLCDPYVRISGSEREELLRYYYERSSGAEGWDDFHSRYRKCAIQRLMQALGAYGVIGLLRGKPEFLRHIQPAVATLREVAAMVDGFKFLTDFIDELPDRPKNGGDHQQAPTEGSFS